MSEDERGVDIDVSMSTTVEIADRFDKDDFAMTGDDLKKINGLDRNAKRRAGTLSKRLEGTDGAKTKQLTEDYANGYALFDVVLPPYNLHYLGELFHKNSTHASAVSAKVSNIVGLGHDFVESPKTKQKIDDATDEGQEALEKLRKKLTRVKNDLDVWLDGLNKEDTFTETLMKVWTDYETMGNGYIEIGRKVNGEIGYVGHIPAQSIRVRRDRDGYVQIISNKATFFRNFGDKQTGDPISGDTLPNELIHIKRYSPSNSYYGVPEIVGALDAVAGNTFSSKFNLDYFEHKATPRYVVVLKGVNVSRPLEQKIMNFFESGLKGKNHRTLVVPLPQDSEDIKTQFEMKAVEAGKIDASFMDYKKDNRGEILMAHRVPMTKVGMAEGASLAVARDADKTFKEQVCRPAQKIMDKKINLIIAEKTDIFVMKQNELTLTDADTQSKIDERRVKMQLDLPNEVRARDGLPGIKGGDKPFELAPKQATDRAADTRGNRQRDSERSASAPDNDGESRNPQGEGRSVT